MNPRLFLLIALLLLVGLSALEAVEYVKNPYRAMVYSAILPGGGQIYTDSYLKAAIVIGVQAWFISQAVGDHHNMDKYGSQISHSNSETDAYNLQQRNKFRNDLRSDYWWIGTTMFLSIADSFVDAHLYNYKAEKSKVRLRFEDKQLKLEYNF